MKEWTFNWLLVLTLFLAACGSDQQEAAEEKTEGGEISGDTKVQPSEYIEENTVAGDWTYEQIENEVFAGTGEPVEWNSKTVKEGRDFLSMSMGSQCGEGNCGKQIYLLNSHEQHPVRTVVTIPYQMENSPGYIAREYTIQPGEKIYIGCSHLCQKGEGTEFKRAIVVADIMDEVQ